MRSLALLAVLCAAFAFAGCPSITPDGVTFARPATLKDVNDLRTDADKADAKIREDQKAALDAGQAAFQEAIRQGKTLTEASLEKFVAQAERMVVDAKKAREDAEEAARRAKEGQGDDFPTLPVGGGAGAIALALLGWYLRVKSKRDVEAYAEAPYTPEEKAEIAAIAKGAEAPKA